MHDAVVIREKNRKAMSLRLFFHIHQCFLLQGTSNEKQKSNFFFLIFSFEKGKGIAVLLFELHA